MGKYTHVSIASEKVSWQSFQKVDEIVSVKFKMYILFDIANSQWGQIHYTKIFLHARKYKYVRTAIEFYCL